ncbi:MAG: transposase [Gammaproteobacteria bacterium]|nr:transposase [Gammaproteobacteria bacterium]
MSASYCIDTAGYAILSNHYHLLLHVDQALAESLTDDEVLERWCKIHHCPALLKLWRDGVKLSAVQLNKCVKLLAQIRDNLSNISRFMGDLNEKIARWANKEDQCKGRFWEGRFECQAILDRDSLLQTLCYVDLNPVRAGIASTPESSRYTSIYRRLRVEKTGMLPFVRKDNDKILQPQKAIPIYFEEYLALLDWTGKELRYDKRGAIAADLPPILTRIGRSSDNWLSYMRPKVSWFPRAVGSTEKVKGYARAINQHWVWQLPDEVP